MIKPFHLTRRAVFLDKLPQMFVVAAFGLNKYLAITLLPEMTVWIVFDWVPGKCFSTNGASVSAESGGLSFGLTEKLADNILAAYLIMT